MEEPIKSADVFVISDNVVNKALSKCAKLDYTRGYFAGSVAGAGATLFAVLGVATAAGVIWLAKKCADEIIIEENTNGQFTVQRDKSDK